MTGVRCAEGRGAWGVRQVSFISRNWIRRFAELWSYAKLNYDDVTDGLTAGARLRAHHIVHTLEVIALSIAFSIVTCV